MEHILKKRIDTDAVAYINTLRNKLVHEGRAINEKPEPIVKAFEIISGKEYLNLDRESYIRLNEAIKLRLFR